MTKIQILPYPPTIGNCPEISSIFAAKFNVMIRKILCMTALALSAGLAWAQMIVPPGEALQNDPSVRVGKLENGLTYYIKHNAKPEKRAEFYLYTGVGAIEERPAQAGLAHFLEHMAFNGSKNFPEKGVINSMEKIGARFGENINAGTGIEETSYMLNNIPIVRPGIIDTSLLVLYDWTHLLTIDPVEIDKERPVIIEELRTRRNASWRVFEATLPVLYKDSKYASCNLIGTAEGLESFPAHELTGFYKKWYRPDLQAIIVVGDFDVDDMEAKIQSLFATIPTPQTPDPREEFPVPGNKEPLISIVTDPELAYTSVSVHFKHQPIPNEMNPLGMVYILNLMKSMASSMLNERLRELVQKPDAPFLDASVGFGSLCRSVDRFSAGVAAKEGAGLTAFNAALLELERVVRFGFTESELERAKANLIRRLERRAENAGDRTNAEFVQGYIAHYRDNSPYLTPEYELQIAKGYLPFIMREQVNELVKESITDENIVITYSAPQKAGVAVPEEKDFITALRLVKSAWLEPYTEKVSSEPLVNASLLKGGKVERERSGMFGSTVWMLDNGVRVVIKPTDYKKDEVTFTAFKQGGTSTVATADLPSVEVGLANFMQVSGVSKFPLMELNKKLTGIIASVQPYLSTYEQGFRGSASPKDVEVMLQLLYLRMAAPRFVEAEFAPVMAQLHTFVSNMSKQPNFLFNKELYHILYPENPRRIILDEEIISKIDFSTMERVYKALFGAADGMTIVIVGNITPDEIKPLVEKYIGSLPLKGESPAWRDEGVYLPKGLIEHSFNVPMETPKATVRLMYHGELPNTLENKIKMSFLRQVLDLVYTETLREEEGGTYGVSTNGSVDGRPLDLFQLVISFDTNPERASELAALAKRGISDLAARGPTSEQVQKTIGNMVKRFEESRIQNGYWSSALLQYARDRIDGHTQFVELVSGMTVKAVQEFAQKILSQGNFVEFIMLPQ